MRYQYFFEQDRDKPVMLVALYACLRKNQAEEENHDVRKLAQVAVFIGPESDHWLCLSLTN